MDQIEARVFITRLKHDCNERGSFHKTESLNTVVMTANRTLQICPGNEPVNSKLVSLHTY